MLTFIPLEIKINTSCIVSDDKIALIDASNTLKVYSI